VLSQPAHPYTRALLSAVPVADPEHQREVIQLGGELPSPANPPAGCHFHPRCPQASAQCREAYPAEHDLGHGHRAACWLHS
jgi:peptide/nickel transport system ATP-binding protein